MKNGVPYAGQFKVDFSTCDSVKNPEDILGFPGLIDSNGYKMVSALMLKLKVTDQEGNILYSK